MCNHRLVLIILFGILLSCLACSPELFEKPKAPVINSLEASAYEVDPGDTVLYVVSASESDDKALFYEWSADGGQFLPPLDRAQIKWVAPIVGAIFTITVKVSNEKKSTSRTATVTVRSYAAPYVEILSPKSGEYYVQYHTIQVSVIAQHSNGINQVNLYLNDSLRSTQSGHAANQYNFSYLLREAAGTVNVKVAAIAKVTGTTGSDSVKIVVEGVVLGKKEID